VLNLVLNARDAMPQGGTITVSVERIPAGSDVLRRHVEHKEGDYILLAVRDTGIGMDQATRERIFEPFFTTKDIGKGTGLGLATVYGIVEQSNGWISVESNPGQGARFSVFLPEAADAEKTEAPAAEETLCGTETLLVVDDEESIRELATVFLGGQGYKVISASSGEEALDLIERHSGPIHGLITDALMPGMGGMTLAKRLRELLPAIKILFISGYAEDSGILSELSRTGEDYLQKPFGLKELAGKVRHLLNGSKT
jgi:CheY-like chemotaxis protein/anti-sigma regulatory factor (Ser/Thr protein kinase)